MTAMIDAADETAPAVHVLCLSWCPDGHGHGRVRGWCPMRGEQDQVDDPRLTDAAFLGRSASTFAQVTASEYARPGDVVWD